MKEAEAGPIENHREREEKGVIVYPVYSRRSGGLSIGVNLFVDKKKCNFNCPYCEVFDFKNKSVFSLLDLKEQLLYAFQKAEETGVSVKDVCFSGNGEPTLSPYFIQALNLVIDIRKTLNSSAKIVVITNGTGFLNRSVFMEIKDVSANVELFDVWVKIDAGCEDWYKKMNNSNVEYRDLISGVKLFAELRPFTIQTMHCAYKGEAPPQDEIQNWINLVCGLVKTGNARKIQIYGKARSSPQDPLCEPLPLESLQARAALLKDALKKQGSQTPALVYE
ncbi:MAG: radical SAM protein [Spirochaetaceae bacterium]|jgi:histidinol dehydrogenase|nr:radical SAM protein [Spirochaetaceae bacterium]